MKVVETRSAPKECLECGSDKVSGGYHLIEGAESTAVLCYDCGTWFNVGDVGEEEPAVQMIAPLGFCPHCLRIGEIAVGGGEEWCTGCGLNPSVPSYPTPDLAHLWKSGSGIRMVMDRDVSMCEPDRPMGKFVRTRCGPHCVKAEKCPQKTLNLVQCYKREFPEISIGGSMSKKSKKKRRQVRHAQKRTIKRTQRRALVQCAGSGWFEKVLHVNAPNLQQTGDTGSGSGT